MTNLVKITLKENIVKNVLRDILDLQLMEVLAKVVNVTDRLRNVIIKLGGAIAPPKES